MVTRLFPFALIIFLTACALPTLQQGPKFINHTPPAVTLDFAAFELQDPSALGCDEISKPSELVGALRPAYPLALCFVVPSRRPDHQEPAEGTYLYRQGGLFGMYARYVIQRDGKFQVIQNADEFKKLFAPIESPDEALAYAIAVTGLDAVYGLRYESAYVYSADSIEDTFARTDGAGYLVHLFHFREFGCGPHEMRTFDLQVSRDGAVNELARQAIYRDPKMDNLCVD